MLDAKAITKVQTIALAAIIVVTIVIGGISYWVWSGSEVSGESIRIGVCGDLDMVFGKAAWQGAILAAEQLNAQGGVLGRNITIVAEDDDSEAGADIQVALNAFTKLITVEGADFVLDTSGASQNLLSKQKLAADQNKIIISLRGSREEYTQRVLDDYDKYKNYFRAWFNESSASAGMLDSILTLGDYSGFKKLAILVVDNQITKGIASALNDALPNHGFDVIYNNVVSPSVTDFTSYFAAIEASGAQIVNPILSNSQSFPFIREYADRQSPLLIWGTFYSESDFWNLTGGKAEYTTTTGLPIISGYPLTNKTVPTREAYIERWGEIPPIEAALAYDVVRFILPDAIRRAGTIETEAMISALEATDVETSLARRFVFTSSHDVMVGEDPNNPDQFFMVACKYQWQNGEQIFVYPQVLMEEAGATFKFPDWTGPWNK